MTLATKEEWKELNKRLQDVEQEVDDIHKELLKHCACLFRNGILISSCDYHKRIARQLERAWRG